MKTFGMFSNYARDLVFVKTLQYFFFRFGINFNKASIKHIFRTDIDGTIILITDGNQHAMKSLDTNEIIHYIFN
jgi:hypothetical protein